MRLLDKVVGDLIGGFSKGIRRIPHFSVSTAACHDVNAGSLRDRSKRITFATEAEVRSAERRNHKMRGQAGTGPEDAGDRIATRYWNAHRSSVSSRAILHPRVPRFKRSSTR